MSHTLDLLSLPTGEPTRGLDGVHCPDCGDVGCIVVSVGRLDTFVCGQCEAAFRWDQVQRLGGGWPDLLAWIRSAPVLPERSPS